MGIEILKSKKVRPSIKKYSTRLRGIVRKNVGAFRYNVSQEEDLFSFVFKQNLVLMRLTYSHQSLRYIYVIRWNGTL